MKPGVDKYTRISTTGQLLAFLEQADVEGAVISPPRELIGIFTNIDNGTARHISGLTYVPSDGLEAGCTMVHLEDIAVDPSYGRYFELVEVRLPTCEVVFL